jgi:hypothetical protein
VLRALIFTPRASAVALPASPDKTEVATQFIGHW